MKLKSWCDICKKEIDAEVWKIEDISGSDSMQLVRANCPAGHIILRLMNTNIVALLRRRDKLKGDAK